MPKLHEKEVILQLEGIDPNIIKAALEKNFRSFFCEPEMISPDVRDRSRIFSTSDGGDILVLDSLNEVQKAKDRGKIFAMRINITGKADEEKVMEASRQGAMGVFVETEDWKIIPLENLVAQLHGNDTRLYARIDSLGEVQTMLGVLEKGVDGLLFTPKSPDEIDSLAKTLQSVERLSLTTAKVVELKDLGLGDRVCIDTASMLKVGDGALVGNQADLLFLVHSETIGSEFSAPRPFRVNAGAVHCYILLPDGKTKYLSEIEAGDEVLIVNKDGHVKSALVGRAKMERRPLRLIRAEHQGRRVGIMVQNAETIRLVRSDGSLVSVTELKVDDELLAHTHGQGGRHFGLEVDEFVLEK